MSQIFRFLKECHKEKKNIRMSTYKNPNTHQIKAMHIIHAQARKKKKREREESTVLILFKMHKSILGPQGST